MCISSYLDFLAGLFTFVSVFSNTASFRLIGVVAGTFDDDFAEVAFRGGLILGSLASYSGSGGACLFFARLPMARKGWQGRGSRWSGQRSLCPPHNRVMNWLPSVRPSTLRNIARPARRNVCRCNNSLPPLARPLHHAHGQGKTSSLPYGLPPAHKSTPGTVNATRGFKVAGAVGLGLGLGVIATSMRQGRILFER